MTYRTYSSGALHSSLSSGFPALPPACLYTVQTTKAELQRLIACVRGIQQQQDTSPTHKGKDKRPASPIQLSSSSPPVCPSSTAPPADEAATSPVSPIAKPGGGTSIVTHACLVFSRWTPYRSIVGKTTARPSRPRARVPQGSPDGAPARGNSEGAPQLPGSLYEIKEEALERLKRYEACLTAAGQQHSNEQIEKNTADHAGHKADGDSEMTEEPREHEEARNALGVIMSEISALDPAEFLLLYSRMQAQLGDAALAAASPLPPSLSTTVCRGVTSRSAVAEKEGLAIEKMKRLPSETVHVPSKCEEDRHHESNCCSGSPDADRDAATAASTQMSPSGSATTSAAPASRSPGETWASRGTRKGWGQWGDTSRKIAYDSVGNELCSRYFLRTSLTQQYWKGLLLDSDSWFEMTIETIASYMALNMHAHSALQRELETANLVTPSFPQFSNGRVDAADAGASICSGAHTRPPRQRPLVAADGCCGAGGDVRQLSRHFDLVLGVDKDLLKVALCRHNAGLLASTESECAPVVLLHQELQQLAALRGCWSVRDPSSVITQSKALTLAALTEHQEALNESLPSKLHNGQWRGRAPSPATEAGPQAAGPRQLLQLPGARRDAASPAQGEGVMETGMLPSEATSCEADGIRPRCLCVPFSSLLCRLCAEPAFAADTAVRDWRDSGSQSSEPLQVHSGENEEAPEWEGRPMGPLGVAPEAVLPIDWLYMSPPWGGENYEGCRDFLTSRYFLSTHQDLVELIVTAARLAPNVCLFLPRSTDLHEVLVLAALLHFPLIEVEMLYLPSKQQPRRRNGHCSATAEACPVYPKAAIIYLVREVHAWVEGRGVPSGNVYLRARQGRCRGWCSSGGAPQYPQKAGQNINVAWRSKQHIDFAFCELPLTSGADCTRHAPTADMLSHQDVRGNSSPLSFSQLLHAVDVTMAALRTGGRDVDVRHPSAVEEALKQGRLDVALTAFSSRCGPDINESLKRLPRKDKPDKQLMPQSSAS